MNPMAAPDHATDDNNGTDPAPPAAHKPLSPAAERALAEAAARRAERERAAEAAKAPAAEEVRGRGGLDPARYGDWEVKGIVSDF